MNPAQEVQGDDELQAQFAGSSESPRPEVRRGGAAGGLGDGFYLYIGTGEGWLYLAGVKDFASREIVGYAMGERMTTELVQIALQKALRFRKPVPGCIHHADRGSHYCSRDYRSDIEKAGLLASMSGKGNWYHNAPTESFWGHLKQELVYQRRFSTRAEAMTAIREYIEIFYNRKRRHSALGNTAPCVYDETYFSQRRSA